MKRDDGRNRARLKVDFGLGDVRRTTLLQMSIAAKAVSHDHATAHLGLYNLDEGPTYLLYRYWLGRGPLEGY